MSDREAFEKWWTDRYTDHKLGQIMSMTGELTGIYKDSRAELSWLAWQAAQAQAGDGGSAISDALTHGTGIMQGGKRVPLKEFYTAPQPVNQQLLEALEVALKDLEEYEMKVDDEWGSCRNIEQIEADGELPDSIIIVRDAIAAAQEGK